MIRTLCGRRCRRLRDQTVQKYLIHLIRMFRRAGRFGQLSSSFEQGRKKEKKKNGGHNRPNCPKPYRRDFRQRTIEQQPESGIEQ